jgi:hypothetical protein
MITTWPRIVLKRRDGVSVGLEPAYLREHNRVDDDDDNNKG